MENKISVIKIIQNSSVDGIGLRTAIYCAGCFHGCKNCHNPQTWDINNGKFVSIEDLYKIIMQNPLIKGVTFTGGDPMFQAGAFCELAKMIKANTEKTIWCYTGFTFEEIVENRDDKFELLKNIDVLVDGKYIDELCSLSLAFRGSSNQRIIDVQKSLIVDKIIELPSCLSCGMILGNDFIERHYSHCWSCYIVKDLKKTFKPLSPYRPDWFSSKIK